MLKKLIIFAVTVMMLVSLSSFTFAGANHYYSPGTGSKSSSLYVHGYMKRNGTYVNSYRRSTPDHNFNNNWSTKGNINPYTGKKGTRVTMRSIN